MRLRNLSHDAAVFVIGATAFAVFTTGTAVAVTTSAVSITDATSGKKARVTNQYSVATSQRDPVSGTFGRVDATGRSFVSELPGTPWIANTLSLSNTDAYGVLAKMTGTERLALTALTVAGTSGSGVIRGSLVAFVGSNTTGNCENLSGATFTRYEEYPFTISATGMAHLAFPTPLVLSRGTAAGKTTCVSISITSAPSTYSLDIGAAGYKV